MPWADRHRPDDLSDVILSENDRKKIVQWMENWLEGIRSKRSLVLHGPPGIGKTTVSLALANHFDIPVIEMNASELRNADSMKRIAKMASLYRDLFSAIEGKKGPDKIILIDEADNIFESRRSDTGGDYGGLTELLKIIRTTENPIILTLNDYYGFRRKGSGRQILEMSEVIALDPYKRKRTIEHREYKQRVMKRVSSILEEEGISIPLNVVETIVDRNDKDMRSILNDLESMQYLSGNPGSGSIELWERDQVKDIFKVLELTFWRFNYEELFQALYSSDVSPDEYLLWIDQNLSQVATDPVDLADAYDYLSNADKFRGRIMKKQHYEFMAHIQEIAGGLRSVILRSDRKYVRFFPPQYLIKMGRLRQARAGRKSATEKLSRVMHCSRDMVADQFWFFRELYKNDRKAFESFASRTMMTEEERNIILGRKSR